MNAFLGGGVVCVYVCVCVCVCVGIVSCSKFVGSVFR